MWLHLTSSAPTLKSNFVERINPQLGTFWLERYKEFRSIEAHERLHALTYLLFTSKGHQSPLPRYPRAPPVILDFTLTLESAPSELLCGHCILDRVEALRRIAALMPNDDDPDDDDVEEPLD